MLNEPLSGQQPRSRNKDRHHNRKVTRVKTIGLVGGTGWISTVEYYRNINQEINRRLGGLNFARCILFSLDYGEIDTLNKKGDTEGICSLLLNASEQVVRSGAEGVLLCANTMHMFADELVKKINVPLIHIASATAKEIRKRKLTRVGLVGTVMTMERDFFPRKLKEDGIEVVIPDGPDRMFIGRTIENELLKGIFEPSSRSRFVEIFETLRRRGAEGIILGCTEIPLLIRQSDTDLPLFDTLVLHSMAAVDFALGGR